MIASDSNNNGTDDASLGFATGSTVAEWTLGLDDSLSDAFVISNSDFALGTNPFFVIETGGFIGIGITDPTSLVDIFDTDGPTLKLHSNQDKVSAIHLDDSFGGALVQYSGMLAIYFIQVTPTCCGRQITAFWRI